MDGARIKVATKRNYITERILKIQYKAAVIMTLFGSVLVLLLSWGYDMQSHHIVIDNELTNLRNISEEVALHIDSHLEEKITIALTLSSAPLIKVALLKSNSTFEALPDEERNQEIDRRNQRWKKTADINDPFIKAHMTNPVADYLKSQQIILPGMYGEIFLTNRYGAMIATTGKLTTLAHAPKYWWLACFNDGQGRVFLDDRGFDTSVKGYVLGVVIPIKENNEIIGILKCNVKIMGLLTDVVREFGLRNPGQLRIVRTKGLIVYERDVIPLSTHVTDELVGLLQNKEIITSIISDNNEKELVALAPIRATMGSEKTGFGGSQESIDHIKGNKGEGWHVVISFSEEEAFEVAHETTRLIIFAGVIFTLLAGIVALLLGKLAARPIVKLAVTAQTIGSGHLNARADVTSNDEIGSLAQSLNKMSVNLATITVSRDELSKEIEERKIIEKQLNQFKITLDQTLDCVFMFAPDTLKFIYVNQGAISQVGYRENQFYDMTPLDIKPEFTEKTFRDMISPLLEGKKKSLLFETIHKHKNGTLIPVEVFLQFVKQPTEKNGRFLAIVRDLAERKKVQEQIRLANQQLQTVLDTVDAMIYVADLDTYELLFINRYVKEHFGDIKGKKCWEAIQAKHDGPCAFCEYQKIRENNQLFTGTHVWQVQNNRNGEWYECRDEAIEWVDGRTVRIQVATNISEQKKTEQEREKLIEELQTAISEIKILRGILPICSFCKNIRNDDGYYEQIEGYIHKHSGVDFTHTICPSCTKEHYPKEYASIMKKKGK